MREERQKVRRASTKNERIKGREDAMKVEGVTGNLCQK